MKKLLPLAFVLLGRWSDAQDALPQHSLSLVVGPNWAHKMMGICRGCGSSDEKMGYALSLDYATHFAPRWQAKFGFRYSVFNAESQSDYIIYPSEFDADGNYIPDPNLPHYVTIKHTDRVLQYFTGIRWLALPRVWSWYADAEFGIADFIEPPNTPRTKLRPSLGIGVGLAWQPAASGIAIFVQPSTRYIFRVPGSVFSRGSSALLIPTLEAGIRRRF
ncbi:MAG: hypothetical protein KIS77_13455 [Saprospiraceae bacterium]|nr:hypothetical protein [Saprospiraceae bacterium]